MKRNITNMFTVIIGLLLIGAGLFLVKTVVIPEGFMQALPYVAIGLGCGIFGHGMGEVISKRASRNNPEFEKQMRILKQDERNVTIENRSKAKAYDMMVFVFGALMLTFALMGIDMVAILLLVFAYLFVIGYGVYYRCRFDKEM